MQMLFNISNVTQLIFISRELETTPHIAHRALYLGLQPHDVR